MKENLPNDPCILCLVRPCCDDPCRIMLEYMTQVYDLAESDPNHPILDRFHKNLRDGILDYVERRRDLDKQIKNKMKELEKESP